MSGESVSVSVIAIAGTSASGRPLSHRPPLHSVLLLLARLLDGVVLIVLAGSAADRPASPPPAPGEGRERERENSSSGNTSVDGVAICLFI